MNETEFQQLLQPSQECLKNMVAFWTEPKRVALHLRGFHIKACFHDPTAKKFAGKDPQVVVSVTFVIGAFAERQALLQLYALMAADVKIGPPPAGPLERKLQQQLKDMQKKK